MFMKKVVGIYRPLLFIYRKSELMVGRGVLG